jgi:phosphatidylglycerol:prolipoprotein diacylglycerol transferase
MYPVIDLGFATVESFDAARFVMVVVAAGVFALEWKRRFGNALSAWGLAGGTFVMALAAGKVGAFGWTVVRPEILPAVFDVSPTWVQEGSRWLFAGLLCGITGASMFLAGVERSVLDGLDALAPALALGQVIYRTGCFLAGDGCHGGATDLPWGVAFPEGSVPVSVPVHPTMLYEGILMLGVFGVLWHARRRFPKGALMALFLALTSVTCFATHFFMIAPTLAIGLTEPQLWSLVVGPVAAGAFALRVRSGAGDRAVAATV